MSAFAAPALAGCCRNSPAAAHLTLDVFAKGGSVSSAAIIMAGILAFFIKETGSAANQLH